MRKNHNRIISHYDYIFKTGGLTDKEKKGILKKTKGIERKTIDQSSFHNL